MTPEMEVNEGTPSETEQLEMEVAWPDWFQDTDAWIDPLGTFD